MNSGQNAKIVGMKLLQQLQILIQRGAVSIEEKDTIASYINEGMKSGSFAKLESELLNILDEISIPDVVESMLMEC